MNIIKLAGDILFIFDSTGAWQARGAGFADQPYDGVCHSGYPPAQYGAGDSCQLRTNFAGTEARNDCKDPSYRNSGGIENSIFQLGRVLVVSIIAIFGTTQTAAANAVANKPDGMGASSDSYESGHDHSDRPLCGAATRAGGILHLENDEAHVSHRSDLAAWRDFTMPLTLKLYTAFRRKPYSLAAVLVLIHDGYCSSFWPASFTLTNVLSGKRCQISCASPSCPW